MTSASSWASCRIRAELLVFERDGPGHGYFSLPFTRRPLCQLNYTGGGPDDHTGRHDRIVASINSGTYELAGPIRKAEAIRRGAAVGGWLRLQFFGEARQSSCVN